MNLFIDYLLFNDTDIISDDEDHIYTRTPKDSKLFTHDTTITTEIFSTFTNPNSDTHSTNAIETQQPIKLSTHCSQIIPSMSQLSLNTETIFKVFSYQTTTL